MPRFSRAGGKTRGVGWIGSASPWLCGLLAWMGLVAAAVGQPAERPVVETLSGPLRGESLGDRLVFLGIPFAKPPLGALRWRRPEPAAPWTEPRDASKKRPACLQSDLGWNAKDAASSSEDCLYLDVATPDLKPKAKLPVLVWIHGGANWAGSSGGTVFSSLTGRGMVVVAIQYRLGALGFLSHPELSAEQGGASGNYALMDQIAALEWVKANIARFGGDPERVTIAGGSAGAQDVGLLSVSPLTRGLFVRTIQQSGTAGFGLKPRTLAENEAVGVDLANVAGVRPGPGALAALRGVPGDRLLAAQAALASEPDSSFLWLHAVVDGRVVTESPAQAFASGRPLRPALLGANAREIPFGNGAKLAEIARRGWGEAGARALSMYGEADPLHGDAELQFKTDAMFRCPAEFTAEAVAASGAAAWLYEFDLSKTGPVAHGSELSYVLDDLPVGAPGVTLQAFWANFIRAGDPNGPGLPAWPRWGGGREQIDFTTDGPKPTRVSRPEICALLGRP